MRMMTRAAFVTLVSAPALTLALATPGNAAVSQITVAPAGSVGALAASCPANAVCMWNGVNFRGTKITVRNVPGTCWHYTKGYRFPVKSLITGRDRAISSMRAKINCRGTASVSYRKNVRVPDVGYGKYGFPMVSFR
ncbi:hypothetical protein GCM10009678_73120 [Actinomadura kijaniata]|uniref:Peptidase inhibitor family I36 n=1 Tax=Actinomadura namibiensis TaxID=182080 RepID=A0A7W3M0F1_ACTNM|nr:MULTISPECIES: peptidase inhibitor family I36 protein [Actinomadura]MBA8957563.1 hypothetical protein [Actinomadura namibiensis]